MPSLSITSWLIRPISHDRLLIAVERTTRFLLLATHKFIRPSISFILCVGPRCGSIGGARGPGPGHHANPNLEAPMVWIYGEGGGPTPDPPILRPRFLPPQWLHCTMSATSCLGPPPLIQILDPHLHSAINFIHTVCWTPKPIGHNTPTKHNILQEGSGSNTKSQINHYRDQYSDIGGPWLPQLEEEQELNIYILPASCVPDPSKTSSSSTTSTPVILLLLVQLVSNIIILYIYITEIQLIDRWETLYVYKQ